MKLSACVAVSMLAGTAFGQAAVTFIDPPVGQRDLIPMAISSDGLHVTGFMYQPVTEPNFSGFRWSLAGGVTGLGTLAVNAAADGYGVSADGSVIVGESNGRAFRWTASGMVEVVGPGSAAFDVSGDGSVIVGIADGLGFRKVGSGAPSVLNPLASFDQSIGQAVSADGTTVVGRSSRFGLGYGSPGEVFYQPTRWVGGGAPQAIPGGAAPWQNGWAMDVSVDGAVTVGTLVHENSGETQAFRHDAGGGTQVLPSPCPGGYSAVGVSADGSVVVGDSSCGPWVYDAVHGVRLLETVAASSGVSLGNVTLSFARGVSGNGTRVLGEGNRGSGYAPIGFVFDLPTTPPQNCSADFNGDGDFGTDADIEAFFACLGGTCCGTCGTSDFNNDGDAGTDADIESFFSVLSGGPC